MAQVDPAPAFSQRLVDRAITYLQTRHPDLFPFVARLSEEDQDAFARDLRVGLSDLTESGSKRGTSSAGFLVSDKRLKEVVAAWTEADGELPSGTNPTDADTVLLPIG